MSISSSSLEESLAIIYEGNTGGEEGNVDGKESRAEVIGGRRSEVKVNKKSQIKVKFKFMMRKQGQKEKRMFLDRWTGATAQQCSLQTAENSDGQQGSQEQAFPMQQEK